MKIKVILQALTGYAGSSESPEKVSARFMGIALGVVSQFAPLLASLFGYDVQTFASQAQPLVLLVACVLWIFGAIKACWLAAKASPTIGAFFTVE